MGLHAAPLVLERDPQVLDTITLYSTLAANRATTFCFLILYEIIFPFVETQNHVVELQSIRDPAQLTSKYTGIWAFLLSSYIINLVLEPF